MLLPKNLYLATQNPNKVREWQKLFERLSFPVGVKPVTAEAECRVIEETGDTFEANATLKARAWQQAVPEGSWILGEDSGLVVDALNGAPGVYSGRFAGSNATSSQNNNLLLKRLQGVAVKNRTAHYICYLSLLGPNIQQIFTGKCQGFIAETLSGTQGFGYDPLFIPEGFRQTFAELGLEVKLSLSHRYLAARKLLQFLSGLPSHAGLG